MDETEYEDGETEGGALPAAMPFGTREEFLGAYSSALQGQERAAQQAAEARQQAYERAQRHIEQSSFGRPTQSEQLLRLSQALLSPRRSRSFGATLANVVPALAQNQQLARQADEQRAQALMQLQQQYTTGEAEAAMTAANARRAGLEPLARFYSQSGGQPIWSEGLQRFIPRDRPVVVETGTTADGGRAERYTDGTMRVYSADGTSALYDAAGNLIPEGGQ